LSVSNRPRIDFLGALGVLAVKNLITARFAQDAKSAKKEADKVGCGQPLKMVRAEALRHRFLRIRNFFVFNPCPSA
jgi:hypothetical protein